MSYRIIIKGSADADSTAIETYLLEHGVAPELVLAPIADRIAKDLAKFPNMHPICQYDNRYRQMVVNSYLVFYHVDEEKSQVEIHHIWHGMRNIEQLLKEKGKPAQ